MLRFCCAEKILSPVPLADGAIFVAPTFDAGCPWFTRGVRRAMGSSATDTCGVSQMTDTLTATAPGPSDVQLLDVRAVAALLDCSPRHVYRMANAGHMPP